MAILISSSVLFIIIIIIDSVHFQGHFFHHVPSNEKG